jgi:hypothetical protein
MSSLTVVEFFRARAQARALLYILGEFSLHQAVDPLQEAAVKSGLVRELGQDAVQAIMARAFGARR